MSVSQTVDRPDEPEAKPRVHPVDQVLPFPKLLTFGLQHLFIMYAGAVAVPLIVGPAVGLNSHDIAILVSADLLVSGIATIIQSAGTRLIRRAAAGGGGRDVHGAEPDDHHRQPVRRSSRPALCVRRNADLRRLRSDHREAVLDGASVLPAAGVRHGHLHHRPVAGRRRHHADPGQTRQAGDKYVGSVGHIALAGLVILLIILITRFFRGFIGQIAVLIGIVDRHHRRLAMGLVDFSNVKDAKWFGVPQIFHFGHPRFAAAAIITMCIVMLVTYTESTADMLAVGEMVDEGSAPERPGPRPGHRRPVRAAGRVHELLPGHRVRGERRAGRADQGQQPLGGHDLRRVPADPGTDPKVGQIIADLPGPVIGGAATIMFAMVTAVGIQTLHKVNFEGNHNLLIVATSLAVGLIPAFDPTFYQASPRTSRRSSVQHHLDRDRRLLPEPVLQPLDVRAAAGG